MATLRWWRLEAIYKYSDARQGRGVVISKNGIVLGEHYGNGSSASEVRPVRSCSKSFTATLIAKMVQMGLLTFDTLVCTIITEWASDPLKSKITVRDLMQQRSGMQAIAFQQLTYEQVIALPCGPKAWDYDNSHWIVLAEMVRRIVTVAPHNKISASHALKDWVLTPAGIEVNGWDQLKPFADFSQPNMASGANLTLPNFLKFGEFLLKGGPDAELLAEMIRPSPYAAYAMGFWLSKDRMANTISGNADLSKTIPAEGFAAVGLGFNLLYVLLDRRMVIARTGGLIPQGGTPFIEEEFLDLVMRL